MGKHRTDINVRYAETDRMGVVYYANYFLWFEVARTEYLKSKGLSYRQLEEKNGIYLMVVEASCKYKQSATYDDDVVIETWVTGIKNVSLAFEYNVYLNGALIAEGKTVHVCTDKGRRPVKIPQILRDSIK
jgi:acyl-CoA thioester hydrolase